MATSTSDLKITGLDFFQIKRDLKEFLQQQDTFKDYNFDGSGLSVLLDVLAYNTYYSAMMAHIMAREGFLSTAQRLDTAVGIAKHLGYVPHGVIPSSATVNLFIENNGSLTDESIIIPKNFSFNGKSTDSRSYQYRLAEQAVLYRDGDGNYATTEPVVIRQGELRTFTFVFDPNAGPSQYVIPDSSVDLATMTVASYDLDSGGNKVYGDVYTLADNINEVKGDTAVYFVDAIAGQKFRIYFGDNVIGKTPAAGTFLEVNYYTSVGPDANGIGSTDILAFEANQQYSGFDVETTVHMENGVIVGGSTGGDTFESLASVKFNAPKYFQAQNRAVTARDYEILVRTNFANAVESVRAWGGETLTPKELGRVYVAVKFAGTTVPNEALKDQIKSYLETKCVISLEIVMTDPVYTYIIPTIEVVYQPSRTSMSEDELAEKVKNAVTVYGNEVLGKFGSFLNFHDFLSTIVGSDNSIVRATVSQQMYQEKTFLVSSSISAGVTTIGVTAEADGSYPLAGQYVFQFNTKLDEKNNTAVESTKFAYQDLNSSSVAACALRSNGPWVYVYDTETNRVLHSQIGQVDLEKGVVTLGNSSSAVANPAANFIPLSVENNLLKVFATPDNDGAIDILPDNFQILNIPSDQIAVNVQLETRVS